MSMKISRHATAPIQCAAFGPGHALGNWVPLPSSRPSVTNMGTQPQAQNDQPAKHTKFEQFYPAAFLADWWKAARTGSNLEPSRMRLL